MVATEGLAPFRQNSSEAFSREQGLRDVEGNIRKPESREGGAEYLRCSVERELAIDPYPQFTTTFLELPRI